VKESGPIYNGRGTKDHPHTPLQQLHIDSPETGPPKEQSPPEILRVQSECDADVFMMIRLKRNGQILFFNSCAQWPLSREQLVSVNHQLVAAC
jgi:hypothetical protein